MNINLTKEARQKLEEILSTKGDEIYPRIRITAFNWAGPVFDLALDELRDGDVKINSNGIEFVVEKPISVGYKNMYVDYRRLLFTKRFIVSLG